MHVRRVDLWLRVCRDGQIPAELVQADLGGINFERQPWGSSNQFCLIGGRIWDDSIRCMRSLSGEQGLT